MSVPLVDWKAPEGVKTAVIVCEPALKVVVVKVDVAVPPVPVNTEPGPRSIEPSKNSTAPVGVAPVVLETVAVNESV